MWGWERRKNENQSKNRHLLGSYSSFPVWIQFDHLQQLPHGHVEHREARWLHYHHAGCIHSTGYESRTLKFFCIPRETISPPTKVNGEKTEIRVSPYGGRREEKFSAS